MFSTKYLDQVNRGWLSEFFQTFLFSIFLVLAEVSRWYSFKLWNVVRESAKHVIVHEVTEVILGQKIEI
jgi:hypothetical protein